MMSNKIFYEMYSNLLDDYDASNLYPMNLNSITRDVFIKQLVDSHKRIEFINTIKSRDISDLRLNPHSELYDPIKAAILYKSKGNYEEAFWNIFLYVLFGKNADTNYNLTRVFYSKNYSDQIWSWDNIISQKNNLEEWFEENYLVLKSSGKFGNHRKYSSLRIDANSGSTLKCILSYFELIGDSHEDYFSSLDQMNKYSLFDYLYKKFSKIYGFSRLSVFDFLCMIGKVGLIDIEPDNTFLKGATGPTNGTKLLFNITNNMTQNDLNDILTSIGSDKLGEIPFIMQTLEDAICNWQKSPSQYKLFKG